MHQPQTLCRLQPHKLASEQLHGDATLMEFFHLAQHRYEQENQTRRGDLNPSINGITRETVSSRTSSSPTLYDTKESN